MRAAISRYFAAVSVEIGQLALLSYCHLDCSVQFCRLAISTCLPFCPRAVLSTRKRYVQGTFAVKDGWLCGRLGSLGYIASQPSQSDHLQQYAEARGIESWLGHLRYSKVRNIAQKP